nr:anaphase-promoting complex subunit 10-like [Manis javanica]
MTTPNKTPPGADPKQLERTGTVREIGSQAVWSLSSCKPGFGVDQLRDDNLETYWQSDGSQPHLVNIQFRRKTTVKTLCIYADYKSDESYTPSKISVRVGNNFHNLQEIRQLELVEPSGWIHVPLTDNHKKPTRTFMIQIAVLANHQNGRDTHMRQIKIYTPVEESSIGKFPRCTTIDFMMYRTNDRDTILPIATPPLISSSEAPKGKTTQEKEQQQDTDGRGHAHEQPFQPQGSL